MLAYLEAGTMTSSTRPHSMQVTGHQITPTRVSQWECMRVAALCISSECIASYQHTMRWARRMGPRRWAMKSTIPLVLALVLLATACDHEKTAVEHLDELQARFGNVEIRDLGGVAEATDTVLDAFSGTAANVNPYTRSVVEVGRYAAASAACLINDGHLVVRSYHDRRFGHSMGIVAVLGDAGFADGHVQFCVASAFLNRLPVRKRPPRRERPPRRDKQTSQAAQVTFVAGEAAQRAPRLTPCVGARRDDGFTLVWFGSTGAMCKRFGLGPAAKPPLERRDIQEGDVGPDVYDVERRLAEVGEAVDADGQFDDTTSDAVRALQENNDIEPSGVVNADTQVVLYEEVVGDEGLPSDARKVGTLELGDQGERVFQLQQELSELGYAADVTGIYDEQTTDAVASFQAEKELNDTGRVNPATLDAVTSETGSGAVDTETREERPTLSLGTEGPDVRDLQEQLRDLGYDVEVSGIFDAATDAAVRQFQQENDLEVDGDVGPDTYAALDRLRGP